MPRAKKKNEDKKAIQERKIMENTLGRAPAKVRKTLTKSLQKLIEEKSIEGPAGEGGSYGRVLREKGRTRSGSNNRSGGKTCPKEREAATKQGRWTCGDRKVWKIHRLKGEGQGGGGENAQIIWAGEEEKGLRGGPKSEEERR